MRAQDYPRVEHVVVDGGSSDGTVELLESWGDRVRWLSEPARGQAAAINKGWAMSHGDILAWLNADDTYLPGAIGDAVAYLDAHPNVDVVYGECACVDAVGEEIRPFPTRAFDYAELVRSAANYIPQPATFIRRRAFEATGPLEESLHYVMDYEYWLRVGLRFQFGYLPVRLATLRLHPDAKSWRAVGSSGPELLVMFEAFFATTGLPVGVKAAQGKAMSNVHYLLADRAFWREDFREARRQALRAWRWAPRNVRVPLWLALAGQSPGPTGRRAVRLSLAHRHRAQQRDGLGEGNPKNASSASPGWPSPIRRPLRRLGRPLPPR